MIDNCTREELIALVSVLQNELKTSAEQIIARSPSDEVHAIACGMLEVANSTNTTNIKVVQADAITEFAKHYFSRYEMVPLANAPKVVQSAREYIQQYLSTNGN